MVAGPALRPTTQMLTPPSPLPTRRADLLARLAQDGVYDLAVVGGGATGLGVAVDAAARGLRVLLVESHDFAQGTSSRSTKLLHGGVRYLAQGNLSLVREALHERRVLLANAPHLAQPLAFVVPVYRGWHKLLYGTGLRLYDLLAGADGLGATEFLSPAETIAHLPHVRPEGLCGGVKYWDGQFNDARLAIALARTAAAHGALLLNYCSAGQLVYEAGKISGLHVRDTLGGGLYPVRAHCVVNAAGVWVDQLRKLDGPAHQAKGGAQVHDMVAPSQGVHLVLDRSFLDADYALMVPHTEDGRVLFLVPWQGKVLLGTTDTPRNDLPREPMARTEEVDYLLREAARYLTRAPTRADVRSIWVGLRPLVRPPQSDSASGPAVTATRDLSRSHTVLVSASGLVTVTGGKWTTYRAMALDVMRKCVQSGLLPDQALPIPDATRLLRLTGAPQMPPGGAEQPDGYGCDRSYLQNLPGASHALAPGLTEAMLRFAARHEYAITVEDALARRTRLLFLDARLALSLATQTGQILEQETGIDPQTDEFCWRAEQYLQIP